MIIGVLQVDLYLPDAMSLKDKRRILRSLKDRLRNKWNISFAEVEDQDVWGRSQLAFAVVAPDGAKAARTLQQVLHFLDQETQIAVLSHRMEFR